MVTYKYLARGQEQYITSFVVCSEAPVNLDRVNDAKGVEIIDDDPYHWWERTEHMPVMVGQDSQGKVNAYIESVNATLTMPDTFKMVAPFRIEAVIDSASLGVNVGDVIALDGLYQGTPFVINFTTPAGTFPQPTEWWRLALKVIDTNRAIVCKDIGFHDSGDSDRLVDVFYAMDETGIVWSSSWGKIRNQSLSDISQELEPTLTFYKAIYNYLYYNDNPVVMYIDNGINAFPRYSAWTPAEVNAWLDINENRTDVTLITAVIQFNTTGNVPADKAAKDEASAACYRLYNFAKQQKQCVYAIIPMNYYEYADSHDYVREYTANYEMRDSRLLVMGQHGFAHAGLTSPLPMHEGLFSNIYTVTSPIGQWFTDGYFYYYDIDASTQSTIDVPKYYHASVITPIS